MSKQIKLTSIALAFAISTGFASAQDETGATPSADTVVATVNGNEITLGHMATARSGLPQQYLSLPDETLFRAILDQLVNQAVLSDSFEGELPKTVQRRLENERRSLVASVVLEQVAERGITDEALKETYEEQYATAEPEKEYNAAHILVETEEKATELVAKLEGGADFAALAKEHSTGPSGPSGGELGWFGKGMMVAPFEAAVVAMKAGDVSAPVQTQFGWHVIKLSETREKGIPGFDEVKADLESALFNKLIEEEIAKLTASAAVDRSPAEAIDPAVLKDDSLISE